MSKTIEIPDIAQYEDTDSELAKLNIMQLLSDNKILTRKFKKVMKQIIEQDKRIDKAIEYLKDNACYENTISELFCDDLDTDSCMELLNILRGKDETNN